MWRVRVRREGCVGSWWGNRRERNHWGDLGVDGWIILEWLSRMWDVGICFILIRTERDMFKHVYRYSSPNIVRVIKSRRMRWAGHVARMGEERRVYRVLVGKPEGKRPLGIPRRRWVDNIRMALQEVGCGYMDCIGLAQDGDRWRTLVSAVMNLRVP